MTAKEHLKKARELCSPKEFVMALGELLATDEAVAKVFQEMMDGLGVTLPPLPVGAADPAATEPEYADLIEPPPSPIK